MTQKLKRGKLLVKKDAPFKKPSSSLYKARAATVLKKAFELSELCDVDVCIIWYDREGNLVKTWPENEENKVRAMAERYNMLSEQERNKKSTNLLGFLNKKMIHDKKESLKANDGKFLETALGLKDSLQTRLREIKDCLQRFDLDQPLRDLHSDPSLINVDLHHHDQPSSSPLIHPESSFVDVSTSTTTTSSSKFSVFLYNHENGMFTQLPNSPSALIPSFQNQDYGTSNYMDLLLGEQDCNNWDLLPPLMQTQTPNFEQIMQTQPSFGMMLS
ncbi:unnamed protein product [Eruca vesicaria subsp. sativa]|uniref:MADS-box domain-containing protein n=1 Tax=Eruca vesicaria subsp. sativa TaxID=29727 RepID=A0ABC8LZB8_ERUVS|nr:unnamed protein product [Eruca vesicaria subsp. sativa]